MTDRRNRERGIVAVMVVVAIFAITALAALAMDASHVMTNKARLQGIVDAAALTAAKALDQNAQSTSLATTAGTEVFTQARATYPELNSSSTTYTFEYSSTYQPFTPGSSPARFVRVTAGDFATTTNLLRVAGVNSVTQSAVAVSGPQPIGGSGPGAQVCNIVPIAVCGIPNSASNNYGVQAGSVRAITMAGGQSSSIGPGNYMFLDLDANGGAGLREGLAGSYAGCATVGGTVVTKTGVNAGPARQGINSRFSTSGNGPLSSTTYPPDVVGDALSTDLSYNSGTNTLTQGNGRNAVTVTSSSDISTMNNAAYRARYVAQNYQYQPRSSDANGNPTGVGAFNRREVAVPIVNCSGANGNGNTTVSVLGSACLFLLQPYPAGNDNIFAEVISNCAANGEPGTTPSPVPGGAASVAERIVLFRAAGSPDS